MNDIMKISWPILVFLMLLIAFFNIKNPRERLGYSVKDLKNMSNQVMFLFIFIIGILIVIILTGLNMWSKYVN